MRWPGAIRTKVQTSKRRLTPRMQARLLGVRTRLRRKTRRPRVVRLLGTFPPKTRRVHPVRRSRRKPGKTQSPNRMTANPSKRRKKNLKKGPTKPNLAKANLPKTKAPKARNRAKPLTAKKVRNRKSRT